MAAAAGLHFNLAASLGSAPLTPFGAFGNPFAAAVAPFGVSSRFNGGVGNGRPNGSGGGKPPTFDMSLAETLGHHHHAAAMAAAAAAAELAAYHHAAQQHQQQQQQQQATATTQAPTTMLSPIEPLKLKSDLIITSNKSNHSGGRSSRSSRSSNSSHHSDGRSTPPSPPPQKPSAIQHEIVAEPTGTQS